MDGSRQKPEDELGDEVNQRALRLMQEFQEHFEECVQHEPEAEDARDVVFQAWAIQKIAGLQLSIEELVRHFNAHLAGDSLS